MKINRETLLNNLEQVKAGLSPREFIEQSSCLSIDSVLHTLGGDFTIRTLLTQGRTEFYIYSTDGQELKVGKAHNLRKTRENADVFQVVLDTGHSIKLTSDHLVMMRDGTYRPVSELKKDDSVMPFNHRFNFGYYWVYSQIDSGRIRAHEWVYSKFSGGKEFNHNHVHHKDLNPWNNSPENLQEMTRSEHLGYHTRLNPPARMPHVRKMQSERMKGTHYGVGIKKPGTAWAMRGNQYARKKKQGGTQEGAHKSWKTKRLEGIKKPLTNHKVVSVEYAGKEDVYDLSVEKYHNFAVNGIFVHNCYAFKDGMVMTFNDEIACRMETGLDITGAVQAQALLGILEKLDDPELKVRENDKGELEFRGKRKAFGITKDAEIFLPIDKVETPKDWKELSKEFTEAVALVQHCVSTDESRFLLTCIHLHPEYVESCDNLQIIRVDLKTGLKESILVRGTSLAHITSLAMDKIALTKSWIHFKNQQGLIFSCRRYSEDYPSLDKLIDFKGHSIVIPKGLAAASDRAAVFATDKAGDPLMSVTISNGVIRILGEGLSGWYKEVKKVAYEGPPLEFLIAPELLKHISAQYSDAQITDTKLKVLGGSWVYCTVLGQKPEPVADEDESDADEDDKPKKKSRSREED